MLFIIIFGTLWFAIGGSERAGGVRRASQSARLWFVACQQRMAQRGPLHGHQQVLRLT